MKNVLHYIAAVLLAVSCDGLNLPVLDDRDRVAVPSGQLLEPSRLFGVWTASFSCGDTNDSYFEQSFRMEFQDVNDAEALMFHWYTDGSSEIPDSLSNIGYTYEYKETEVLLTPKAVFAARGAAPMRGVYLGNDRMILLTENESGRDSVCTLTRTGDPAPAITGVDRTLPSAGDVVTITGRNLQFVDHVFLPVVGGEIEVTEIIPGSKEMKIVIPDAEFRAGSIRCQSTSAHESCYSPACMFCYDCIFFHNFISQGYQAPYAGSEFEYTISSMGSLKSNVTNLSSDKIPEEHSLAARTDVSHPDSLLSFFGNAPVKWEIAESTDDKDGYLRFSTADRFQYVLDNCNGLMSSRTPCADLAVQMDVYVMSDGLPEWNTGYLSYRLNKDQNSLASSMLANVAMWEKESPMSFADGWKTLTIPLSTFAATVENASMSTLGGLISSLKSSNLQTLLTLVNYPLDSMHPSQELESFQFSIADVRLVPYRTPANTKDQ